YASESEIADKQPFHFTTRMKAYSAVLVVLVAVMVTLVVTRSEVEATVLRTPGMLFQEQEDGRISNLYNFKVVNKTNHDIPIEFRLMDMPGEVKLIGRDVELERAKLAEGELFIVLDRDQLQGMKTKVKVGVYSGDKLIEEVSTSFVGPMGG
ncbi:MAG: cytochrome c oxidase accessory protein CcoG, partial [Flavobacteriales bacterium]|nr:cytochrome c oxidase accessory protein CcoG [Flavobacteriales bacterium]